MEIVQDNKKNLKKPKPCLVIHWKKTSGKLSADCQRSDSLENRQPQQDSPQSVGIQLTKIK